MKTLLYFLAVPLLAQQWNVGLGPLANWAPDPCVGGSNVVPPANAAAVASYAGEYQTFRYGTMTCTIPAAGPGTLVVETIEPTVAAAGLRMFTLSINGAIVASIDIFKLCGANVPCPQSYRVPAPGGTLTIVCTTVIRNGLISALRWIPDPPPAPQVWDCRGVTARTPTALPIDCTGLFYVVIPGGPTVIGIAPWPALFLDPAFWTQRGTQ